MQYTHPAHLSGIVTITAIEDHQRDFERHAGHRRALLEARPSRPSRPSSVARLRAAVLTLARRDHSLTDYPCRLPDGKMGRVAAIQADGEWTLVCRLA